MFICVHLWTNFLKLIMESSKKGFFSKYKNLSPNVLALSLVSLLNDTSSEIIYPLLPAFLAITLGASPFAIGLIEGFAETVSSLLKLFSGYLSDKFGKRKLLVFSGYTLSSLMRPLLAFASSWQQVLVLRVTDRTGKGIRGAPRDALVADSVEPEKRGLAFGFHRAADHFGAVLGPVIAFILLYLWAENPSDPTANDYSRVFLFASIPAVLSLFVIAFFVKEEKHKIADDENITPIKLSLNAFDGNFKRFLLVIALFTLIEFDRRISASPRRTDGNSDIYFAAFMGFSAYQQSRFLAHRRRFVGSNRTQKNDLRRLDSLRARLCRICFC